MFSNATATTSTKQSDTVIKVVAKVLHYNGDLTKFRYVVRKTAHFTTYLILGLLVFNLCKYNNVKNIIKISLLVCILYACTDEIHQLFVDGRSGEIFDVCIDTVGSLIGILTYNKISKL